MLAYTECYNKRKLTKTFASVSSKLIRILVRVTNQSPKLNLLFIMGFYYKSMACY